MSEETPSRRLLRSDRNRVLLVGGVFFVLFLIAGAYFVLHMPGTFGHPQVVASFAADFTEGKPTNQWHYLWNPKGPIGNASNYVVLHWNGSMYVPNEIAEYPQPPPAHYLRLQRGSGHPGFGCGQGRQAGNFEERFVIAGFSVSKSGRYWLTNSSIARRAGPKDGTLHVRVFVNDHEIGHPVDCRSTEPLPFNCELGGLSEGDTIYVGVGPNEVDVNDGFDIDFAIAR